MRKHLPSALALLLITSSAATAQLTDSTARADTVQIRAQRGVSAVTDVRFRAADMALRPRSSAQDLLRLAPGLVIAQHAGGGKAEQIFLRGFDADHGTDVNITIDDAPINMVSHGHGQGYADLHFVIPETVRQIDVVKGPYLARYGDMATAGAVAFTSADTLKESLLKLEGGSYNTYRALGLFRTGIIPGRLGGYFGGEIYSSDGYFDAPQDYRRLNLVARLQGSLGGGQSVSASLMSFSSGWDASGQVPDRAVRSGEISRFGAIDPNEGGSTSRSTAIIRYQSKGGAPLLLTASVTDYRFRLYSDFTFFAADSIIGDMIEQTDQRSILSFKAEQSLLYDALDIPMLTRIGATLRSDDIDAGLYHDSVRTRVATIIDASIHQRQIAPYVEQEIHLPFAEVMLGLRADYFNFDVEDMRTPGTGSEPEGVADQLLLSPKANIVVPITDQSALFFNAGYGFHSNDARVVVARQKETTLPRAFGAEIGGRTEGFEGALGASAAVWMLDLQSEFVYVGDEGTTEESGRTRRTGIDLELHVNPLDWLALGVDGTLSKGRYRDLPEGENRIPLAPNLTLTANAQAKFDRFTAALRLRHIDSRPANETGSVTALGYSILDLSASCTLGSVDLFVNIENLLDAEWNEAQFDTESRLRNETEAVSELHYTPGTPRSIRGGVAVRF